MAQYPQLEGIEIKGEYRPEWAEIITPEAVAFFAKLQRKHNARRKELLQKRVERQVRLDAGELPDFLP
ncbi:MAG: malate synthase A, partial [Bacteroidetes bacterium]|nr:malate synthase A [Bacteroidota bacterium]